MSEMSEVIAAMDAGRRFYDGLLAPLDETTEEARLGTFAIGGIREYLGGSFTQANLEQVGNLIVKAAGHAQTVINRSEGVDTAIEEVKGPLLGAAAGSGREEGATLPGRANKQHDAVVTVTAFGLVAQEGIRAMTITGINAALIETTEGAFTATHRNAETASRLTTLVIDNITGLEAVL